MFQFVVILEISHKSEDLIYLLDFVQKACNGDHVGFMAVYKEIPVQKFELKDRHLKIRLDNRFIETIDENIREPVSKEKRKEKKETKLYKNIANSKTKNNDFSCTFCGKYFSIFSKVKEHIKNNHKQVK